MHSTRRPKEMRCIGCSAILKTPRGITRDTQKCGECRGKKHGAKKSTSRYRD